MSSIVDQVQDAFEQLRERVEEYAEINVTGKGAFLENILSTLKENTRALQRDFQGKNVTFIGDTGSGKSWTLNILLLLTQTDRSSYVDSVSRLRRSYVTGDESKSVQDILDCYNDIRIPDVASYDEYDGQRSYERAERSEQILRNAFGLRGRRAHDSYGVENLSFFLPVAGRTSTGSTTSVPISLKWGSVWHYTAIFYDEVWAQNQVRAYLKHEEALQKMDDPERIWTIQSRADYQLCERLYQLMTTKEYRSKTWK